jgi:hypothetical protein
MLVSAIARLPLLLMSALLAPMPALANGSATPAPVHDAAARLPQGSGASEYWDLTARFESGHRMFVRFLITDIGPGDHNAVAIGHMILPDGQVDRFANGGVGGGFEVPADGLRLDVKNSHLDLHPPTWRLLIDKPNTRYDLRITPRGHPPTPPGLTPEGYRFELLDIAAPIEGTLWHKRTIPERIRVRGVAAVSHTWTERAEAKLVVRRIEFFSLDRERPLHLTDLTRPSGKRTRWLTFRNGTNTTLADSAFELELLGEAKDGASRCYPVPAELQLAGAGVGGRVDLERTYVRHDPLAELPQPFRFLAERSMRPHRVWEKAPFELSLRTQPERAPLELRGTGVAVMNFVESLEADCK